MHFATAGGGAGATSYDGLIVATGAHPVRPSLPGIDSAGVHVLHTVDHALDLQRVLDESGPETAVIARAGYIGLEMAEALLLRGIQVTVVEQNLEVLPTVDQSLGALLRDELEGRGARVCTGTTVAAIELVHEGLRVVDQSGRAWNGELVLISVGVRPTGELAAGAELGERDAIRVDREMATKLPAVWAAGDCAESHHHLLERSAYLPLGTTAHKQGRIAGENAIGGSRLFEGSLGTQVVRVLDLVVARTGLRDDDRNRVRSPPPTNTGQFRRGSAGPWDLPGRDWRQSRRQLSHVPASLRRTLSATDHGIRRSRCSRAARLSCSIRSDSLTGLAIDQCAPTGQRWSLHQPNRSDFRDAPGIQIVVYR